MYFFVYGFMIRKQKRSVKNQNDIKKVARGRSNRCASFQLERSKVMIIVSIAKCILLLRDGRPHIKSVQGRRLRLLSRTASFSELSRRTDSSKLFAQCPDRRMITEGPSGKHVVLSLLLLLSMCVCFWSLMSHG